MRHYKPYILMVSNLNAPSELGERGRPCSMTAMFIMLLTSHTDLILNWETRSEVDSD